MPVIFGKKSIALGLCYAAIILPAGMAQNAHAQSSQTSVQYNQRANQLIPLFNKQIAYNDFFAPNFLEAVPAARLDEIINGTAAQYGNPIAIQSIQSTDRNSAIIKLQFEKAVATIKMAINPIRPNKVSLLLIEGFEVAGDNYDAIKREISALPGKAGFAIHRLTNGNAPIVQYQLNGNDHFAIASTFKLYILAELAAQIQNGQRRWTDVAPLSPKSTTLGGTENWPEGSPLSLQTLATLMISISDNNATDALIAFLGRSNIEARIRQIGHSDIDRITPLLTTAELFSLKMSANDRLRKNFLRSSEREQQNLLVQNARNLTINNYNSAEFGRGPLHINDIEWFASTADIARVMNILRRSPDPVVRNILAINSGIGTADARKWNYLGYKGGSEPGVISLSFVVQSRQGQWYSVSGSWNNPRREVDQNRFVAIMTRALNILAR